jgi:nucleotidyltransferase/DNA polymerase involved in DNA repair
MATAMGGVGKQVFGELKGVVKKTAEDTAKAGVDIVKGTVENTIGGSLSSAGEGGDNRQVEQSVPSQVDPMQTIKKESSIKKQRGLQRVREEIAKYINKKKQEDDQEEMVEERQEEAKKDEQKQVEESERETQIRQAQRSGGGTGEMSRKKH